MEQTATALAESRTAKRNILGCCLATFWAGSVCFGYPGVMGAFWQAEFGAGAGETGLVITVMLLAISFGTLFSGKFLNRFGMRTCIFTGTALLLAAMAVLSCTRGIRMVYVWAFLANLGVSFVYGPGLTTVQRWLPKQKGLACGLLNVTFGLSAAVMSPVFELLLSSVGYHAVNFALAACILLTNALAMTLVRNRRKFGNGRRQGKHSLTMLEALKTRAFWLIWFTWAFVGAAGIAMVSIAKGYAEHLGLASVVVLTAFNFTNGLGRLIAGELCDKIGGEKTACTAFLLAAVGFLLMPFVRSGVAVGILAAFTGYSFGTLFTTAGPIASRHFGLQNFGSIFGLIFAAYGCFGGFLGPYLSGVILERAAAPYQIIFAYLALFTLIGAALTFWLMKTGAPKMR